MMEEQKKVIDKGATMRLGSYECALTPGTLARKAYGADSVRERHRHRYEVNNAYVAQLQKGRHDRQRHQSAAKSRRDDRAQGSSVVSRHAISPRIPVQAQPGASACSRLSSRAAIKRKEQRTAEEPKA